MKRKLLKNAIGAMREIRKKEVSLKGLTAGAVALGALEVGAGYLLERVHEKKVKRKSVKKVFSCGKKYRLNPKDSHKTKMQKLRKFNKCRRNKKIR